MTELSPELTEAIRQRAMHRTSQVEALSYQYGLDQGAAEARYDADTAVLAETGALPGLPPSPDISGSDAEADPVAEAVPAVEAEADPVAEATPAVEAEEEEWS